MTSTALFVALFGILACLADAQLRRSTKQGRALESLKYYGSNPTNLLGKCEGDCDKDSDCLDQLICFEKDAGGSGQVPGCLGKDTTRNDYCIDPADIGPPTGSPPIAPTAPTAPTVSAPFTPTAPAPTGSPPTTTNAPAPMGSPPTTTTAPAPTGSPPTTPTAPAPTGPPPTTPTLPAPTGSLSSALHNYGASPPTGVFPLGLCEGDCDYDSDCASGLVCLQRGANAGPVPGCTGSDTSKTDFCVSSGASPSPPSPSPTPLAPTSSSFPQNFKLKMYWEPGYFWQEETFDRKWCLRCRSGSCSVGDQFYIETCSTDGVQRFDFDYINSDEVMIRLHGTSLCLERVKKDNYIRTCDSGNSMQHWWAETGGFDQHRFEISPVTATDLCVTQRHQPKADEEVHLEPCSLARRSDTSLWNRCYDNTC